MRALFKSQNIYIFPKFNKFSCEFCFLNQDVLLILIVFQHKKNCKHVETVFRWTRGKQILLETLIILQVDLF